MEIAQTNFLEEKQALNNFRDDIASNRACSPGKVEFLHRGGRLRDREHGKILNSIILNPDGPGDLVQAASLAVRANNEFFLVRPVQLPIKVNFSLRFGIEGISPRLPGALLAGHDLSMPSAGFAPSARGVEREVGGIRSLEGAASDWAYACFRERVQKVARIEEPKGSLSQLEGSCYCLSKS